MYEQFERLVQLPATRICAPFLLGGALMLLALAQEPAMALQAGGLVALLACLVLVREASQARSASSPDAGAQIVTHLHTAALHASLFAMSFLLAALGMGLLPAPLN